MLDSSARSDFVVWSKTLGHGRATTPRRPVRPAGRLLKHMCAGEIHRSFLAQAICREQSHGTRLSHPTRNPTGSKDSSRIADTPVEVPLGWR